MVLHYFYGKKTYHNSYFSVAQQIDQGQKNSRINYKLMHENKQ